MVVCVCLFELSSFSAYMPRSRIVGLCGFSIKLLGLVKSFCMAQKTINKTKRQPSEWEKTFSNKATGKGLASKIYKQLMQLNIKSQTNGQKN